ncbi:MAG: LacI family DNA-binding transcriptional regulator [Tropicimonas sp.]|uniref:LacI family DNA-binding transcriptional regulator n=1 Tax=Tropicimonas sp. TaxID=2067044 RepID=UPI003A849E7F
MKTRVTLKHIAAETGLSVSSISLALRGDKRFPESTVRRVREAAERLGYIYNQGAANLRRSRTDMIAVCLGELSNPVFNDVLAAAEHEIHRRGKRLLLGVTRESRDRQADFLRQALQLGCEALLLCPAHGTRAEDLSAILLREGQLRMPTALMLRAIHGFPAPQVVSDEYKAGRLAARAAIRAGHRRLYWLGGGQETAPARLRRKGALDEIREAGLEPAGVLTGKGSRELGRALARRILAGDNSGDIALVCFSDLIALGALSACHELQRPAGRAVSVIGCDDMAEAQYAVPPLSSIHIDFTRIVAQALDEAMGPALPSLTVFEPDLVLRESLSHGVMPA